MRVAIVHDWLTGMRGGEKVLELLCKLYPSADLFTLLHIPGRVSPLIESHSIRTSFIQNLPFSRSRYRYYLPLMPRAIEQFNFSRYNLILSSSHCVAKNIKHEHKTLHICYCHTPMRYIWDQFGQYFFKDSSNLITSSIMLALRPWLQCLDVRTSSRVNHFIANSCNVQNRIKMYYKRESTVIYPPVDTTYFRLDDNVEKENYFLIVSALVPYKRLEIAIDAFNKSGRSLVIIGEGQCEESLKKTARPNIVFKGGLDNSEVRSHYARCRALVFCGEEDFGIVPLEAQAMGRPVIAFGKGGVLETVIPDLKTWKPETGVARNKTSSPTGVYFYRQTHDDLNRAIQWFESIEPQFNTKMIRAHALKYDTAICTKKLRNFIEDRLREQKC